MDNESKARIDATTKEIPSIIKECLESVTSLIDNSGDLPEGATLLFKTQLYNELLFKGVEGIKEVCDEYVQDTPVSMQYARKFLVISISALCLTLEELAVKLNAETKAEADPNPTKEE